MPLSENGGGVSVQMPVVPAGYGGGYAMPMAYGGNMGGLGGMFGGDAGWLLLLILICGGGWGGLGGFGGGMMWPMMGGMMGMEGGFGLYPWLNNSEHISDGFRDQQLSNQVGNIQNAVTSGFGDVQTALCGGFGGVNQNISSTGAAIQNALCQGFNSVNQGVAQGFAQAEIANNARQIADMQQNFAAQTATLQGFNGVGTGIADLKYTVATENCADRAAVSDGIRDVIANAQGNTNALLNTINGGIQAIKDQLCQDKIDAKNDTIAQLRQELLYARGQDSQNTQTARILAGQTAEVDALYDRLNNCPVPCTPVYGRTPIFSCNGGCNGGCNGNGVGFAA